MKAYVLHGINQFQMEEKEKPVPKEGEVLVQVMAAGICGSDIPRAYRTGAHVHPIVIGHEFSGKVVEVAAGADASWLHKPVGVFPLIPCRNCGPCMDKQYEMCRHYDYLGSRRDGGFAEYVAVPCECLIELPEGVSYEQAAMLEPMAVAVHAMRRVKATQDDRIVVCGLGTIGLFLAMFLKGAGMQHVYVIGNKEFQKQRVLSLGIPEEDYCDSRKQDVTAWLEERTGGKGADVFFECVGKNETVLEALDLTAPAGKVMLVGNPHSDMELEKAVYWKILRNQLTVMGTWNSSFTGEAEDDWHYVLDMLAKGEIAPEHMITHRYGLAELEQGFHIMRDKSEDYIKIMGVFS
ncbi:MAG: galactitol-1-phosphate 5-dehydrogenase [Lachnospiraceae bacterium]|nr:galactitol-1-phosphate 5-dehydrogenase [Lachnospiraceae bacterium]